MKRIKKNFINIKKFIKNEPLFAFFVLSCVINGFLVRALTVKNYFDLRPIILDLVIVSLFGLISLVGPRKKRFRKILTLSIIFTIVCIINATYYSYYSSFVSVSLIATSLNVLFGVGDAVKEQVIHYSGFIYIWQVVFIIFVYYKLKKSDKYNERLVFRKKDIVKNTVKTSFILMAMVAIFIPGSDWSRFGKLWNRESALHTFGVYIYQMNDIIQSLQPKFSNIFGHDNAFKTVNTYYEKDTKEHSNNDYTDIFKGKNVIVIHAESIQKIAMELSFYGKEITPNLNKLAKEGIFFSNFYSEVGVGTSSDAEFTFATSLMPSSRGTVFVNYFNDTFVTIQKLLKEQEYGIYSMHGNTCKFWNRDVMHKNMGYDKFYCKDDYEIDEEIGLGLSDKSFFKQSTKYIEEIKKMGSNPFYVTTIMLSNHTPFSDFTGMDEYPTTMTTNINGAEVVRDYINGTTLGNYFRSVHYADQAIGEFISELDNSGLLENTIVVIYGDHDAKISKKDYDILYNYDPFTDTVLESGDVGYIDYNNYRYELDKSVPFIIWTKDKEFNMEVTTPMGMIDVLPTLGNMLGVSSKYQLGNDIFNIKNEDNTVVFTDGSFLTSKIYYNAQNGDIYPITSDVIDENYISSRSEYADELIQVSNYIITYDLIKELE